MGLDTFLQDIRIGLRVLRKERGFCFLAVAVLALGICAVTTQFAVVNGVLLRGFSFPDADRLVSVQMVDPATFTPASYQSRFTTADFVDLREQAQSFSAMTGYLGNTTVNLSFGNDAPRRLQGGYVPWDFFRVLGVSPARGRDFEAADDRPGVTAAIMLSDAFWRSAFGADPQVIGRPVRINGRAGEIVGVMPPSFAFPSYEHVWIPYNAEYPVRPRHDPQANHISVVARLRPDVSLDQAEEEVSAIARRFATDFPATNADYTLGYVQPLIHLFTGAELPTLLYTMLTFCAGVLLIACVNVMNMQFARATLRAKELAIRSALGATRWRLIRQMLTESLLLAALGAVFGVAGAYYATDWLNVAKANLTNPLPGWMVFNLDPVVLAVVVGTTVVAALVAGFVPAWLASRATTANVLKDGGRGNTGRSVRIVTRGLVVAQILLTTVLLIGALLELHSIRRQQTLDYGYDTTGILSARLGLMKGDYPDGPAKTRFYEDLLRSLQASPQFEYAALTSRNRMSLSRSARIEIEGQDYLRNTDRPVAIVENVSAGYFDVLGLNLLEGRDFTELDTDQREPVAIINTTFAQTHFGREGPVGRRIRTIHPTGERPGPWRRIIGVSPAVRMHSPLDRESDGSGFFVPFSATAVGPTPATANPANFSTIIVRPHPGQRPQSLALAVQEATGRVDPHLPLYYFLTPEEALAGFLTQNRFIAAMFGLFGLVAVTLASVGLYGIMSFSVNQRLSEFGIRMALGADRLRILRLVLTQGGKQLAVGLGLGLTTAFVIATIGGDTLRAALFETSPRDPLVYLSVAVLLTVVALLALIVPARRATRADPMVALREE
ncbi:ABC transporter permease [Actomonas aquatica]|uniref:ABC transporter permease n=1 Tax=Actomonas aquatica TaxID=2866162 RepID=A0ABZ1C9U7_9BACT|nr:ABC transporter permease [Opitutus sp. WL0086]WRQ88369.1 ABC transporter permease [Opitutus sp. WL0086]